MNRDAFALRVRQPMRGFTLLEVLVVLSIISLLAALAVPRYVERLEEAREAVLTENLKVVRIAIDRFSADTGRYPGSLAELVERRYLRDLPVDPVTQRNDTWLEVAASVIEPGVDGIGDIRSGAEGTSRKGVSYGEL